MRAAWGSIDALDQQHVSCEKKRGIKDETTISTLSNCKNEAAINWGMGDYGAWGVVEGQFSVTQF